MAFKIYTKTGDAGTTGLFGGQRVDKHHARLEAYGTVDELNAFIGVLRHAIERDEVACVKCAGDWSLLEAVQGELFTVGAQLATPPDKSLHIDTLSPARVEALEQAIDRLEVDLPALTSFVLPYGQGATTQAHVCRTVTRRAERRVVALSHLVEVDATLLRYLNRLSDYFFTLSRRLAHVCGDGDVLWEPAA